MKSLDPRVNRLPAVEGVALIPKEPLDQLGTFEVFVQPREGKPFQHEGSLHAPDSEMAFVLAKETYTRRFLCTSLAVVPTSDVYVSVMTENNISVYDQYQTAKDPQGETEDYEVFNLLKRGKQHVHAGRVSACSPMDALLKAKEHLPQKGVVFNVWIVKSNRFRFTSDEEKDLWNTLPEKKFRDASDYKAGDKLKFITDNRS